MNIIRIRTLQYSVEGCVFALLDVFVFLLYFVNAAATNGVFFSAKKMSPSYKCIKKLLTSPVIMWLFIREGQNINIIKAFTCVYHLLRSVARSLLFRIHILSACFYNQKKDVFNTVLTLNAIFLILLTM